MTFSAPIFTFLPRDAMLCRYVSVRPSVPPPDDNDNINTKNCSLSIVLLLTAMDQKPQKSLKR